MVKKKARSTLTLKKWIEKRGVSWVAQALRVHPATVGHWRRGFCLPTPAKMEQIVALSKGAVTYKMIIQAKFNSASKK